MDPFSQKNDPYIFFKKKGPQLSGKKVTNVASRQIYPRHVTVLKAGISVTARHGHFIKTNKYILLFI